MGFEVAASQLAPT